MRVIKKEEEPIIEKEIYDRLDLIQSVGKVKSPIKDNITEDFTFARLCDKDKKLAIEMVHLAHYTKKLIKTVALEYKQWNWDGHKWVESYLPKQEQKALNIIAENTFDSFMTRVYMTVILNRNVKDNYLLKWILGVPEEQEEKAEGTIEKIGIVKKEEEK